MDSKSDTMEGTFQTQTTSDLNILLNDIDQALSKAESDHEHQKLLWVRNMVSSKLVGDSNAHAKKKH